MPSTEAVDREPPDSPRGERTPVDPDASVGDSRLVVVSNRLPLTLQRRASRGWVGEPSSGGLVTALSPVIQRTGGLWLGWPGEGPARKDPERQEALGRWGREHGFVAVDLPRSLATRFYQGYPNQVLWPLFHQFPSLMEYDPGSWDAYVEGNQRFCNALLDHLRPGDLVWVHDYHLMLLPRLIREAAPEVAVGFFLHIPFPASEVVRVLPRREEVLLGILGADYAAFQTHRHLSHFRSSVLRVLGLPSSMEQVSLEDRSVQLEALPVGIAPESFAGLLQEDRTVHSALRKLRRRFEGRRLLLSVDRLDYTKGIPERLRTYRRLLTRAPHLRGKVVLVQIAVPSRGRIPRYRELKEQVDRLVGETNGQFGTPDWTPVVYIRRSMPRAELVALYAASDLGWVTPLRDGMNLVAKEYVACQKDQGGVLVLSEFAGAAAEMGEAVIVNPYDEDQTAAAVESALALPADNRRERMAALRQRVSRNDAFSWAERFISGLRRAAEGRVPAEAPRPLPVTEVAAAFRASQGAVLLLAYDGTLVPLAPRPGDAAPSAELLSLLLRLRADGRHRVAIVSGRSRTDLERWFGDVEGLWLGAEHGAVLRSPATGRWEAARAAHDDDWRTRNVLPVLEHFVDRTPGSFIETKEYSLVWHFAMADPEFGEWLANELVASLDDLLAPTDLRALRAHRSVEVKPVWASKGEIVRQLEGAGPPPDFRLAAGDDQTDEDVFAAMPDGAWTIRVGPGASRARFRVGGPADVYQLLEALSADQA